jgi:hypothetical protein
MKSGANFDVGWLFNDAVSIETLEVRFRGLPQ